MALLALDDTDTREGGCTTHTAHRIAGALQRAGGPLTDWGLWAPPRLVRLCPAIRDKTRGNGAVVLPVGPLRAVDPDRKAVIGVGTAGDLLTVGPAVVRPLNDEEHAALADLVAAHLPEPAPQGQDPQPGAVLLERPPAEPLYQAALVRRVALAEAEQAASAARSLTPHGRRGTIGALAAAAWPPTSKSMTWEAIGYRDPDHPRHVPPDFLDQVTALPGGFDNIDPHEGRMRCVPRTPCPVWFGLRGLDPHALLKIAKTFWMDLHARGGWLMATNQARDAHLHHAGPVPGPERVVHLQVQVTALPVTRPGGHVFVRATAGSPLDRHEIQLAAFEPTKTLREPVRRLRPGDRITVLGRSSDDGVTVALERLRIDHLRPRRVAGPNPLCPCGRRTKSRGRGAGFRCPSCGTRVTEDVRVWVEVPAGLRIGDIVQVPGHVRGHLLGPLGGMPAARPLDTQQMKKVGEEERIEDLPVGALAHA